MSLYTIYWAASAFLEIISLAIFIYCILTWIAPRSSIRYWLENFIQPFCAPFRPLARYIMRRWGAMFDLTCFFAMIGMQIAQRILLLIFRMLFRLM